jgi:hypothetical protein
VNWEAIGALGEILGAVAVVITLIYLAAQLRQNTRALKSSTFQAINAEMSRTTEVAAASPELSGLFYKSRAGLSGLTGPERVQFSMAMLMTMRRFHAVQVQETLGMLDHDFTSGYETSVMSGFSTHVGYQEWWRGAKHAFPADFAARVDTLFVSTEFGQPTHLGLTQGESAAATQPPSVEGDAL